MKNKKYLIVLLVLIIFIFTIVITQNYQYNNCIKINKEELKKCKSGEFGDSDCSIFENAEELCNYRY
jgi:flagellar biosynthesis protein FlhB